MKLIKNAHIVALGIVATIFLMPLTKASGLEELKVILTHISCDMLEKIITDKGLSENIKNLRVYKTILDDAHLDPHANIDNYRSIVDDIYEELNHHFSAEEIERIDQILAPLSSYIGNYGMGGFLPRCNFHEEIAKEMALDHLAKLKLQLNHPHISS